MSDVGRIERVDLREVWPNEARDFTTWLSDNLDVLSEELGITLTDAETEEAAGDFSVDVVATDDADRTVIIENQLERSDHDHLGKLLTYFAMMEADAAVWIVSEARPEHVSAVSWLNESSDADFYLVQVEAIKIGDSPRAPLVRRVVGPSEGASTIRSKKQDLSERERLRHRFWSQLLKRAAKRTGLHGGITPSTSSWVASGAGVSGLRYKYDTRMHDGDACLYIDRGKGSAEENKAIFDALEAKQDSVEREFGGSLEWERLDNARASRIAKYIDLGGYRDDEERWPEIQDAMIDAMVRLEKALRPHIDALDI